MLSKNFNKSILVNDETKYESMGKPAKADTITVGVTLGAVYDKAGSDYATVVKIRCGTPGEEVRMGHTSFRPEGPGSVS